MQLSHRMLQGFASPARETGNFGGFLRHHAQTLGDWRKYGRGVSLRIQGHAACSAPVAVLFLLEHLELGSESPTSSG